MGIEIDIDTDQIIQEVVESYELRSAIESAVEDEVSTSIGRLDIDDIGDFERRVEEIVGDFVDAKLDDGQPDVRALTERVAALESLVTDLRQALLATAIVLNNGAGN
jgi:hypothetical protein